MSVFETVEDHALQEAAGEVVDRVITPIAKALPPGAKASADHFRTIFKALAPLGYLSSTLPRELGGTGMSYVRYGLLLEALARGPIVLGEIVPPRTINYLGTPEQKRRWVPGLLSGDTVSTAAITEPQAGSDMRGFRCKAVRQGDVYRVSGQKRWIKLGGIADMMTLMVVDEGGGLTRLVLDRKESPWISREIETVGIRNVSFAELDFDDVRVPVDNVLGDAGSGGDQFHRGIEASRAFVGIQAIGLGRTALDIAIAYAKERTAFGRPLARFQAIQVSIADAATKLEAARTLCLNALAILDSGKRAPRDVSMAKLFATETAIEVSQVAMEAMGAWGFAADAGVERCWRDARMLTAIDGTSGIQRLIIGREIFGTPAFV